MSSINKLISANGACGLRKSAEKEGRSRKGMQEGEGEDECEYKVVTTQSVSQTPSQWQLVKCHLSLPSTAKCQLEISHPMKYMHFLCASCVHT